MFTEALAPASVAGRRRGRLVDVDAPTPPDDPAEAVGRALGALAPPGVRVGCRAIDAADLDGLRAGERRAVERAVEARRREFASGRALLRALLGAGVELPVGPTRAPVPPAGWTVSLAHDRALVVAAASTDPAVRALGVDVEPDERLDPAEAALVVGPADRVDGALTAVVAKEAAYKAWSALGGRVVEPHDVVVRVGPDGALAARIDGRELHGRIDRAGGRVVALVVDRGG